VCMAPAWHSSISRCIITLKYILTQAGSPGNAPPLALLTPSHIVDFHYFSGVHMEVDVSSITEFFSEFFTKEYKQKIDDLRNNYPNQKSLFISYTDLERIDFKIADALIEQPDSIIAAAEEAIKQQNYYVAAGKIFAPHVRFTDLPSDNYIEQITSANINELVAFKCVVTKRAEVMHRVKVAMFVCTLCDEKMKLFVGKNFTPPKRCESCKKFALR